ncbi:hypothetical protein RCC89_16270 [Cytophagaceae bacterium ABcell3]|nr:hypothetical protein RCC89_16270 [Cytophagaceae bacterium ABcell3]
MSMKNVDIQAGRTCSLKLDPESSSAIEYGKEVSGKVVGRDVVDADKGTLDEMYPNQNKLPVIVVEDEAGLHWNVPERDVVKIVCGDEELC